MMPFVIFEPAEGIDGSPATPWATWNLRRNPFGEPPSEDLPGLVVADVEGLLEWLGRPGHALQFIGAAGRGKSSHLQALRGQVPHVPYVYLAEGEDRMRPFEGAQLLLDEAQRLPRRRRRRLFGGLGWLALATHEDLTRDLEATGWVVRTIEVGGLSRERLQAVVARRLEWARRGPGPIPRVRASAIEMLLQRHGDDLRSILDDLYEATQYVVTGSGRGVSPWPGVT